MRVGDVVPGQTMTGLGHKHKLVSVPGRCIYIHPERRFYTLAFDLPAGTVYESYPIKYRRGDSK